MDFGAGFFTGEKPNEKAGRESGKYSRRGEFGDAVNCRRVRGAGIEQKKHRLSIAPSRPLVTLLRPDSLRGAYHKPGRRSLSKPDARPEADLWNRALYFVVFAS